MRERCLHVSKPFLIRSPHMYLLRLMEKKRRLKIGTKHSNEGEMFACFKTLPDSFPAHVSIATDGEEEAS